jgi:hypothetical protein
VKKKPEAKTPKVRTMKAIVASIKESLMDAHILRIENAAFDLKARETKKGDFLFPSDEAVDKFDAIVECLNHRVKEENEAVKLLLGKGASAKGKKN